SQAPQARKELAEAAASMIGASTAALAGGKAQDVQLGGQVARTADRFNRQLHPNEVAWIKERAKAFAKDQGISEQEATERLTQQALKEVDYLWRAQLADGNDATASKFLAGSGQTFLNDLGEQQKLFTVQGQQLFRPEMFADTADPAFYKQFAQSGIQRSLTDGLLKEMRDSGISIKDATVDLAKVAKDNPGLVVNAAWEAVKNLPQSVVDGFKEGGTAIGEGAAVLGNKELTDKLNAIYGTDVSSAQRTMLAIRMTAALTGAAGVAKAGGELTEATTKAIGKKLNDVAAAKEAAMAQAKAKAENNT